MNSIILFTIKTIYHFVIGMNGLLNLKRYVRKKKRPCICEPRNYAIQSKFRTNLVWLIWDIIFDFTENHQKINSISNLIKASNDIFTINYSTASCKKRRFIMYFVFSLCVDNIDMSIQVINNKQTVSNVIDNIEMIYKQIKKNEVSPNTEYLFNNLEKQNSIKKSIQQFQIVNTISKDSNT